MTISKTTLSQTIGLTRIDTGGPFVYYDTYGGIPSRNHYQSHTRPHTLTRPTFWSWYQCTRCGFKTQTRNDVRFNKGCHIFANYDSAKDRRFDFEDLKVIRRFICIEEEYVITGCNIHDKSEWVKYPATGKAIQEDKFIIEQVAKDLKYAGL